MSRQPFGTFVTKVDTETSRLEKIGTVQADGALDLGTTGDMHEQIVQDIAMCAWKIKNRTAAPQAKRTDIKWMFDADGLGYISKPKVYQSYARDHYGIKTMLFRIEPNKEGTCIFFYVIQQEKMGHQQSVTLGCYTAELVDPRLYEQEQYVQPCSLILESAFTNHMLTCWREWLQLQGKRYADIAEFLSSINELEEIKNIPQKFGRSDWYEFNVFS